MNPDETPTAESDPSPTVAEPAIEAGSPTAILPEPAPSVPDPVDPILQDYAVRRAIEEEILRLRLLLESKDQLTPSDFSA